MHRSAFPPDERPERLLLALPLSVKAGGHLPVSVGVGSSLYDPYGQPLGRAPDGTPDGTDGTPTTLRATSTTAGRASTGGPWNVPGHLHHRDGPTAVCAGARAVPLNGPGGGTPAGTKRPKA